MPDGKNGGIVAFDAATGKAIWTATTDEPSYSAPIVADINGQHTGVFFTRTGLVAVDPASGKVLYQHRWRARMAENLPAMRELGLADEFLRMWDYYLAYCEGAFRERANGVVQLVLEKPEARRGSLLGTLA